MTTAEKMLDYDGRYNHGRVRGNSGMVKTYECHKTIELIVHCLLVVLIVFMKAIRDVRPVVASV